MHTSVRGKIGRTVPRRTGGKVCEWISERQHKIYRSLCIILMPTGEQVTGWSEAGRKAPALF